MSTAYADVEAFFNSYRPVSEWIADQPAPAIDPLALVARTAAALGRKFEVTDLTHGGAAGTDLYDAAASWLSAQHGHWSPWVAALAERYRRGGGLTDGQAKGVLNVMTAEARRRAERSEPARSAPVASQAPLEDNDDRAYAAWLDHVAAELARIACRRSREEPVPPAEFFLAVHRAFWLHREGED